MSWTPDATQEILNVLSTLTDPTFSVCEWEVPKPSEKDGKTVHWMPYPVYDPLVDHFFELCFTASEPANPYETLPEDPTGLAPALILTTPEAMETATAAQIHRFFLVLKRSERFSEGSIEGAFKKGMMSAAARRLAELAGPLPQDDSKQDSP